MVWEHDPLSQATGALQKSWKTLAVLYAFSLFSLMVKELLRVREKVLTMILVTPKWPAQPW